MASDKHLYGRSDRSEGGHVTLKVKQAGKSGVYRVTATGVLPKKEALTATVRVMSPKMAKLATKVD